MKIFISWSGERSRVAANAIREWLPLVLHYVQPWLSDRDIAAGERWAVEIGRELEGTQFGIIVLTADNLTAPWILFEAGALSKAFTASHVCPYLIDLEFKDISGPLSQFQAKKSDRVSTLELLQAINSEAVSPVDQNRLLELFDALWPRLESRLKTIPSARGAETRGRTQGQVLEELVVVTRRMEARLAAFEASGRILPRANLPRREPTITVVVDGRAPNFEGVEELTFHVLNDLVKEFADLVGFDLDDYGKSWHLKKATTKRIIVPREGRSFARRASHVEQTFLLGFPEELPTDASGPTSS